MRSTSTLPVHGVMGRRLHHGKTRRAVVGAAALALSVLLGACGGDGDSVTGRVDGRLSVVASFYPVAEIASRVGGDRVRVTNLTPAGVEPHDLELTSHQVDQLEDAGLVVYLGRGFQPALAKIVSRRDSGSLDVLETVSLETGAFEAVEGDEDHGADEPEEEHAEEDGLDPHFWLDPTLMAKAVDAVTAALVGIDADGADAFRANAEDYKGDLASLDAEFEAGLATCDRREIVTSHAAFHYLARRYRLAQLPIAGLSPDVEPNPRRLAELADEIREKRITTVFFEELVPPAVAEALAREVGVTTAVLSPLEGLSERDAEAGKDYAAVMRENLATLRAALGCR